MPWMKFNLVLLKRLLDSGFIEWHEIDWTVISMEIEMEVFAGEIKMSPDIISITAKGRQFIEELGVKEL